MPKFFVKKEQVFNDEIKIVGTDVNHIRNVLRLTLKEQIEISCPEMEETYLCEIREYNKDLILCDIMEKLEKQTEPNVYIHIFQGLPKSDKMEWIIEKGTEIGISEFTPVEMRRCVVKLDEKNRSKKSQRWQKIAEVAAKQSGRNYIPQVNEIINIKNIYENLKKYDIVLIAYEKEEKNKLKTILKEYKNKTNIKIAVIIGPEGGIDDQEWENLTRKGSSKYNIRKKDFKNRNSTFNDSKQFNL